ncbi:ATP synthase F0 subcomplex A subunit [Luteococcus japonicus]|uniref:ATP synthase subunit a n=3 Tax=Luteococcus japonicus TaxID=33984 RepID=A0A1R4JMV5_9ACTN|nr:ATP synthase F0 subcomplex A subunit [Luteococcus japonicus]SJN33135.1 ATP synthase F0 sector subunit a [Luteococcus japonicus LSP_Lj1]
MLHLMTTLPLKLVPMEGDGGYKAPGVEDFQFHGNWGHEWLTKPTLQAILAALVVIGFWLWASHGLKVRPTKKQVVMERIYEFVRNGIARDTLGHDYRKFLPYLLALFSFILINNWYGQMFFTMFPTFSNIGYAYGLALVTWLVYVGAGIAKHGLGGYLKHSLMPEGVPWWIMPLIIPLEFLSNFITRPLTLSMRLFANMFAGHLVIMLFVVGGAFLATYPDNLFFNVSGALSLVFSFALFALELFVGALQAYVFTVLTAQYVSSSIADEH